MKHRHTTSASDSYGAGGGYGDSQVPPRKPPREPIDYTPHTYAEYQSVCQPGKWEKMGKLGPDLQDEQLIEKRAKKERLKEYSRNLRAQNAQCIDYTKQVQRKDYPSHPDEDKQPTKREKMAMYAKQVPKPKLKKKAQSDDVEDGYEGYGQGTSDAPLSALEELEARHRQDQFAVAQIRKEMGLA